MTLRSSSRPELSGIVVHWRDEDHLARLVEAWPDEPRFELVVVDNGSSGLEDRGPGRLIQPGVNLGFAGAANLGVSVARAPLVLLMNPDVEPRPGALPALLDGFAAYPEAAGLAPRLEGADGAGQHRWQLRALPSASRLVLQAFFVDTSLGTHEPRQGQAVEQPAAACLALRRCGLERIGGLDPCFHPAWFEDVDLARRLRDAGGTIRYWPRAVFRHSLGATVERLGYDRFLWIYYRNLCRYLEKHHGVAWRSAAQLLIPVGMLLRLAALPLRRPRRAASRGSAAVGLLRTAVASCFGWRLPRRWSRRGVAP